MLPRNLACPIMYAPSSFVLKLPEFGPGKYLNIHEKKCANLIYTFALPKVQKLRSQLYANFRKLRSQ